MLIHLRGCHFLTSDGCDESLIHARLHVSTARSDREGRVGI
jgi:hypothetical protein